MIIICLPGIFIPRLFYLFVKFFWKLKNYIYLCIGFNNEPNAPGRFPEKKQTMEKNFVYQMVTDRIIETLKSGQIPWRKPWGGAVLNAEEAAINYVTRKGYSFLNQMLLGEPGEYLTWKQIQSLKGRIKKGAKSKFVVFFQQVEIKTKNKDGEEEINTIPILRYYNVFHLKDTEGIQSKIVSGEKVEIEDSVEMDAAAEAVIKDYLAREDGLKFQNDKPSNKAYYSPVKDAVVVPMASQYSNIAEYYSTTFHELVHSTMKKGRCNREAENKNSFFGNHEYSREELVAEIGSAMICTATGVSVEKAFKNSVAYIQGWLRSLKNGPKMIVWAAKRAELAAKYILAQN